MDQCTFGAMKKIAVLGAGPSGLVAAKEALQNGLSPTIFEKESELGGIWNPITGSVWNTMHTNISKFTTTFGDTNWSIETEMFPSAKSMFTYLNDYADKWMIRDYIKFGSTVVKVSPIHSKDGQTTEITGSAGWTVQWTNKDESTPQTDTFHGIIVATGVFSKGNIPEVRGLHTFPGKIIHSKDYKSGKEFEGLRVMIIGGSYSGAEIASDVCQYTLKAIHSFRAPFWILQRYIPDSKRNQANLPLDLVLYTRSVYSQKPSVSKEEANKSKNNYLLSFCQNQQNIEELRIPSEEFDKSFNAVVSDQYVNQVKQQRLLPSKQAISEVRGSSVVLQNGDIHEVDALIFATGFNCELEFFDESILQKIQYEQSDRVQAIILFKECCHPELENLFFIGMYKGPYFAVMEQQARLAARVLSNAVPLPQTSVMIEGLKQEKVIRDAQPQFPHPEYVLFTDTIANFGNSFPNLKKLESEDYTLSDALGILLKGDSGSLEQMKPDIYKRFMTEPVTPSHYNLVNDPMATLKQMDLVQQFIQQHSCSAP